MRFDHLSCAGRAVVFAQVRRGASQREIARGRGPEGSYCLQRSAEVHLRRRLRYRPRRKLTPGGALWRL